MTGCTSQSLAGHKTQRCRGDRGRWEYSQRETATMAPRRQVVCGVKKDREGRWGCFLL